MLELIIAMGKDAGEACFYYSFNCYGILLCGNNKLGSNFILAFIYVLFLDNTGLFICMDVSHSVCLHVA